MLDSPVVISTKSSQTVLARRELSPETLCVGWIKGSKGVLIANSQCFSSMKEVIDDTSRPQVRPAA